MIEFIGKVEGIIDVKRFHLPGVFIKQLCPHCGTISKHSFDGDAFSYPVAGGKPNTIYCVCECGHDWQEEAILEISIKSVGQYNEVR